VSASEQIPNCPLCGGAESGVVEQLSGAQLRQLWRQLGHEFTSDAWGQIHEHFSVKLYCCRRCGFAFFNPGLTGNEAFYRQMEHAEYYTPNRPEFPRTLEFAGKKGRRRILDVGCGSGSFLDLAKQAGYETCGIELNGQAAAKARAGGHVVFEQLLHELNLTQTGEAFDLITLFQVLEHLSDPVGVLKQASALLKPGGFISIAVPSVEGIYRLIPFDPHQWPPHHVSRWRRKDFAQLARATDLKLVECGGDILLGSGIGHAWKLHNSLAPVMGRRGYPGGEMLPRIISFVYRKTGLKFIFPRWGYSLYAHFQKT
jgi:SAM-dependent methyltransferase